LLIKSPFQLFLKQRIPHLISRIPNKAGNIHSRSSPCQPLPETDLKQVFRVAAPEPSRYIQAADDSEKGYQCRHLNILPGFFFISSNELSFAGSSQNLVEDFSPPVHCIHWRDFGVSQRALYKRTDAEQRIQTRTRSCADSLFRIKPCSQGFPGDSGRRLFTINISRSTISPAL
jgi:hypothetical protein